MIVKARSHEELNLSENRREAAEAPSSYLEIVRLRDTCLCGKGSLI